MTKLKILSLEQWMEQVRTQGRLPYQQTYLGLYSSVLGGVVRDPALMTVPIDDHIVHRGDGVFEAVKCVSGRIYALWPHLERLERSASAVGLQLPFSIHEIMHIIRHTIQLCEVNDCMIRLYVSRGPGGFTADPTECVGSQLYVMICTLKNPAAVKYERGVSIATSQVAVKPGIFANVKSCNYLPNALMRKEAHDLNVDFTISVDEKGLLAEGSTENIGFIFSDRGFIVPDFTRTLKGITATRMLELAQRYVVAGDLPFAGTGAVTLEQALRADEVVLLGTGLDVLPVVSLNGTKIGAGLPGEWSKRFYKLLRDDMTNEDFSISVQSN